MVHFLVDGCACCVGYVGDKADSKVEAAVIDVCDFAVGEFVGCDDNVHDVAVVDSLSVDGVVIDDVESSVNLFEECDE